MQINKKAQGLDFNWKQIAILILVVFLILLLILVVTGMIKPGDIGESTSKFGISIWDMLTTGE